MQPRLQLLLQWFQGQSGCSALRIRIRYIRCIRPLNLFKSPSSGPVNNRNGYAACLHIAVAYEFNSQGDTGKAANTK